jgi:hypothetical protein
MKQLFDVHGFCITLNGLLTALCVAEAAYILVLLSALYGLPR